MNTGYSKAAKISPQYKQKNRRKVRRFFAGCIPKLLLVDVAREALDCPEHFVAVDVRFDGIADFVVE